MLDLLLKPRRSEELLALANERYGMGWTTRTQVDRRRGWLQSAGAIEADAERRLTITELGRQILARLTLYSPSREASTGPEKEDGAPPPPMVPPSPAPKQSGAAE